MGCGHIFEIYESKKRGKNLVSLPTASRKNATFIKQQRVRKQDWVEWQGGCGVRVVGKHQVKVSKKTKKQAKRQTAWGAHGVPPSMPPNRHQSHNCTPAFHRWADLSRVSFPDLDLCYKKVSMDMLSPSFKNIIQRQNDNELHANCNLQGNSISIKNPPQHTANLNY